MFAARLWNTANTNLTLTTVDQTRTLGSELAAVTPALPAIVRKCPSEIVMLDVR